MDISCEDSCFRDFIKIQNEGVQPRDLKSGLDEREACMAECFMPKRGNTDQVYCIERCNEGFDARIKKVLKRTSDVMQALI